MFSSMSYKGMCYLGYGLIVLCSCTTSILDLKHLVRTNRGWPCKHLMAQKLRGEHQIPGSLLIGVDLIFCLWHFCRFHTVKPVMPIFILLSILEILWKYQVVLHFQQKKVGLFIDVGHFLCLFNARKITMSPTLRLQNRSFHSCCIVHHLIPACCKKLLETAPS